MVEDCHDNNDGCDGCVAEGVNVVLAAGGGIQRAERTGYARKWWMSKDWLGVDFGMNGWRSRAFPAHALHRASFNPPERSSSVSGFCIQHSTTMRPPPRRNMYTHFMRPSVCEKKVMTANIINPFPKSCPEIPSQATRPILLHT